MTKPFAFLPVECTCPPIDHESEQSIFEDLVLGILASPISPVEAYDRLEALYGDNEDRNRYLLAAQDVLLKEMVGVDPVGTHEDWERAWGAWENG